MDTREAHVERMIATRRALHQNPEEGWTEFETTWFLVKELRALGLKVLVGRAIIDPAHVMGRSEKLVAEAMERARKNGVPEDFLEETGGFTGCVAYLETGRPGPVTAYRCDIDALTMTESSDPSHLPAREGFASKRPGFMHACGHDAHMAVELEVVRWAVEHKDELSGEIRFLFQPAEEGVRGAGAVAASGLFDDVDQIIGAHVGIHCRPGEIGLYRKGFLATTKFNVHIEGLASHAGALPEKGRSALVAACAAVMMLQGIPRNSEGDTRVCVGTLHAGEGRNITAAKADLQLEVRGETGATNDYMAGWVERIFRGIEEAYDVKVTIEKVGEATTLIECDGLLSKIRAAAEAVPGLTVTDIDKPAGSEDFTLLMRRVVEKGGKAAYVLYGANHPGHHRTDFDIGDTDSLPPAFDFFCQAVRSFNGR